MLILIRMFFFICYEKFKEKWNNDLIFNDHNKLRTYRFLKNMVKNIICWGKKCGKYKSAFAKFRCGVVPLKIETGRHERLLIKIIICFNNSCLINNCIEDEKHVLLDCPLYDDCVIFLLFNQRACMMIGLCTCLMPINLYF